MGALLLQSCGSGIGSASKIEIVTQIANNICTGVTVPKDTCVTAVILAVDECADQGLNWVDTRDCAQDRLRAK
jgi:hypothetical protein